MFLSLFGLNDQPALIDVVQWLTQSPHSKKDANLSLHLRGFLLSSPTASDPHKDTHIKLTGNCSSAVGVNVYVIVCPSGLTLG